MLKPLKLAIVTDIHSGPSSGSKMGEHAPKLLSSVLRAAEERDADAVIDLGDRITDRSPSADRAVLQTLADVFSTFDRPRYHLIGNHDVVNLSRQENAERLGSSAASEVVEQNGWRLLVWQANTHLSQDARFHLLRSDLEWLDLQLSASKLPTVILSHIPLDGGPMLGNYYFEHNPWLSRYTEYEDVLRVLRRHLHVVLCVAGHAHWNQLRVIDGIPFITIQSLTERASDGQPAAAFAEIRLDTEIIWETIGGDPFRATIPLRTASVPRRSPLSPTELRHRSRTQPPAGRIRAVAFDADGVLRNGSDAVAGAAELVGWLLERGLAVGLITNSARMTTGSLRAWFGGQGIELREPAIMTAGRMAALIVSGFGSGQKALVAGPDALREELKSVGVTESDEPDFVLLAIDEGLSVADLQNAAAWVRKGAKLICTNVDVTAPGASGPIPETGSVLGFVEALSGQSAWVVGKPHPMIFETWLAQMALPPEAVLMVGDSLGTDIAGANAVGMRSVLIARDTVCTDGERPTFVVEDIGDVRLLIEENVASQKTELLPGNWTVT